MKPRGPVARAREALKEGQAAELLGLFPQAEYFFRRSLEWRLSADAYASLAWVISSQDRHDEAIREGKKAVELDPDLGTTYNDIGVFYTRKTQTDEAITWFEKALRAPRNGQRCYAHFNLGLVWEKKGQVDQARRCFEGALRERPEFLRAKRALERLQRKSWRVQ